MTEQFNSCMCMRTYVHASIDFTARHTEAPAQILIPGVFQVGVLNSIFYIVATMEHLYKPTYICIYVCTYMCMCCCMHFAFADKGDQYERLEDQTLLE